MERYQLRSRLHSSSSFTAYSASSKDQEGEVIVKEYQLRGITASEPLLKAAIRLAREKPKESAALIDVVLSQKDSHHFDMKYCVNFVFETKQPQVAAEFIKRDDRHGHSVTGLSEYKDLRNLYARGNKKVDLAFSSQLGKDVVIKSQECLFIDEANSMLKEAFLLMHVNNSNVCQLLDICISKEAQYSFRINLITEKYERDLKQDIDQRHQDGALYTERELMLFLKDVALGLETAHSLVIFTQHVAHRNPEPSNIFISADGTYKLGGFGHAWRGTATMTNDAAGAVPYISPEMWQCMVEPEKYQINPFLADVYTLGATTLHMASQRQSLIIDPFGEKELYSISDELFSYMKAVDPVLNDGLSRWELQTSLRTDIMLGIRLSIIQSTEKTLENIDYSEDLIELLRDMLAVDPLKRITLANLIERVKYLIAHPPGLITKLLGIYDDGSFRIFDVLSSKWEPSKFQFRSRKINIHFYTCHAFVNDEEAILCGSNLLSDVEEGKEVYKLELRGSSPLLSNLPKLLDRRVLPGLFCTRKSVFVFGGK